jgi:L-ascorbate metabolism protein UlaG (beta-lactamase superfamily)
MMKHLLIVAAFCLTSVLSIAQPPPAGRLNYWRDVPGMINEQALLLTKEICEVLSKYPPSERLPVAERRLALYSLDALLHDPRLDTSVSIKSFIEDRHLQVLGFLKKPNAGKQIQVLKTYNHGFIVKTASLTIAFDLVFPRVGQRKLMSDSLMKDLVRQCDVLFVSHVHGDHADLDVAKYFAEMNKPVYTPPAMWEGISDRFISVRHEVNADTAIVIKGKKLVFSAYPGHQDNVLNNMYAVTMPEGLTFMHTGDQYHKQDLEWIKSIRNSRTVDVLLLHNWVSDIEQVVAGIGPRLVISGHENEMAHSIDHREPYWLTYRRMGNIGLPFVVMAWGERYVMKK